MKRFMNDKSDLVREAIDGLVAASGGAMARLDGYPNVKVVIRTGHDPTKVAIVSGGGAGHEPAHAGFVGSGMLTAAVSGEVFASPSVTAVLAGILAVTGEAGCLLVVKNYTGDRLNFGLAAERAKALGRKVAMVIVGDDVAIDGALQPRGVAGTLFVHKIAGHLAEQGATLEEVTAAAEAAAQATVSLGLSLSTCTLPGSPREERMMEGEAELGLGIHGEPGFEKIAMAPMKALVGRVIAKLAERASAGRLAALVNNLGAVPPMEMSAIVNELMQTPLGARIELLVGPGPLMTSLDMNGFSLSLLPLNDERAAALVSPAGPSAWPGAKRVAAVEVRALPDELGKASAMPSMHDGVRRNVMEVCAALEANERELDELDAKIGDGDTGATLAGAARTVRGALDTLPLGDGAACFGALSTLLSDHVGGSSGVLLAILFASAAEGHAGHAAWTQWAESLLAGLAAVKRYGGAAPGDRTMIDALEPALEALGRGDTLAAAARAARKGAAATASMPVARAGRAAYVGDKALLGVADPGAEAVARVFERLAKS